MPSVAPSHDARLIGQSEAIRAIEADVDLAARSDAKVLITGETGVGKEIVARLIHQRSARTAAQLVTLNCAGLPDSLLESELFGHVKGSFTGAYRDKPGLLELVPNGTVFLDEVGEMSPRMQAVLLRFLESGEIQRVGSDRALARVNVRLITATNRDLQTEIAAGSFREDLYFRLNVIRLAIPPLRERREDVPLLVDHFLESYSRAHRVPQPILTADAMAVLESHRWPGNVRELKNVIERVVLRSGGQTVDIGDLPSDVLRPRMSADKPSPTDSPSQVEQLSKAMLERGDSFWSAIYPLFMARDLTRSELRGIVELGLQTTNGNYRSLVSLFNMPSEDYKRFLSFLRKYDCHLPFQKFRVARAHLPADGPAERRSRQTH